MLGKSVHTLFLWTLTLSQVINGIQSGPYKNIYNPENFFVGKNGSGAANNWGDGYQTGELVHEDIMEMIDREADGSDSLEVCRKPWVGF